MEKMCLRDNFYSLVIAIQRLKEVVQHLGLNKNDFIEDASIQRFELVNELFCDILKKMLTYEKVKTTTPRNVLKKSYQSNIIDNEDIWLQMLKDRNTTSHVYKEEDAKRVSENIKTYLPVFEKTCESIKIKCKL